MTSAHRNDRPYVLCTEVTNRMNKSDVDRKLRLDTAAMAKGNGMSWTTLIRALLVAYRDGLIHVDPPVTQPGVVTLQQPEA